MTKLLFFICLFEIIFSERVSGQQTSADSFVIKDQMLWYNDSLEAKLKEAKEDTIKAIMLNDVSWHYAFNLPETGLLYAGQGLKLSQKLNYIKGIAYAYNNTAWCQWALGNYTGALQSALQSLHLFEELKIEERVAWSYLTLANVYRDFGDYQKALEAAHQSIKQYDLLHIAPRVPLAVAGSIYELENNVDSGFYYVHRAIQLDVAYNQGKWFWLNILMGNLYRKSHQYDKALIYYRLAIPEAQVNKKDVVDAYNDIAILFKETGNLDSCIYYANEVQNKLSITAYQKGILDAFGILAQAYRKKGEKDSTIKYLDLSANLYSNLFNLKKQKDIQNLAFGEQMRKEELERERQRYHNQLRMNAILGIAFTLLVVALLLLRNNRNRQKAYALLNKQKQETDLQKLKAEQALDDLKTTQTQLIQSEKMASLGELTAGIAHEIQNPLNFVNNFSEVSKELLDEMKAALESGNKDEAEEIANDIIQNLEKINYHGKRADAIVKGMLQHSRASTGKKEPTDLNALADEYLRLSYHGLRTKDKNFNADIKTDFDESIGKINIIPQDIGRVLLNLYNNAFYAVNEKLKTHSSTLTNDYKPLVSIQTKKLNDKIEIKVADNGKGIQQNVIDKIFQPFFTTKPTGQGTGLGLSLAYDIITKEHNGSIKVESKEGEESVFVIQLLITA